jgi:hypothetical protein
MTIRNACWGAVVVAALAAPSLASAAPGITDEPALASGGAAAGLGPRADYALDTELVVHDWVLCVSRAMTESLVSAHNDGRRAAARVYADLNAARACGRFAELRVILRERIASATRAGNDTRAFAALVRVADDWATAFVVAGAVDEGLD